MQMNLEGKVHEITTMTQAILGENSSQGTAFFYNELDDKHPILDYAGLKIKDIWLVTNRHCILPEEDGDEVCPDSFMFYLRGMLKTSGLGWMPIVLSKDDLLLRARFHSDPSIDVALIRITDLIIKEYSSKDNISNLGWGTLSKDSLIGNNPIKA